MCAVFDCQKWEIYSCQPHLNPDILRYVPSRKSHLFLNPDMTNAPLSEAPPSPDHRSPPAMSGCSARPDIAGARRLQPFTHAFALGWSNAAYWMRVRLQTPSPANTTTPRIMVSLS